MSLSINKLFETMATAKNVYSKVEGFLQNPDIPALKILTMPWKSEIRPIQPLNLQLNQETVIILCFPEHHSVMILEKIVFYRRMRSIQI